MDEWSALNAFWNSFSIPAYDENTVPDDVEMPYITYEASIGGFDDSILLSASLYYRSQSWREISQKAKEIWQNINSGHGVGYHGVIPIYAIDTCGNAYNADGAVGMMFIKHFISSRTPFAKATK